MSVCSPTVRSAVKQTDVVQLPVMATTHRHTAKLVSTTKLL